MEKKIKNVLTIIPAKSHSRRLPGKNKILLNGKPLLQYTIEQAQMTGVCGDICVATDDEEIAAIAQRCGAMVPFLRTSDTDDVTSVGSAAYNFLERYQQEYDRHYDYICLLLTTFPLRLPEDIIKCREMLFENNNLDAVISVTHTGKHPLWAWTFIDDKLINPMFTGLCDMELDQLPASYFVDGSVYWARTDFFLSEKGNQYRGRVGGYITPKERSVDVDTPIDLQLCEILMNINGKDHE